MSTPTDYYELLGVSRNASADEIKSAYRALAREHHPDANDGDPESEARFKEVSAAYEVLRDPEKRRRYDMFGPEALRGTGAGPGSDAGFGGIGDIFEAFFGGGGFGGGTGPAQRTADAEVVVELSFEEAVFGTEHVIPLRLPVTCGSCGGSGARPGTTPVSCPECRGAGQVRRVRQSILGQMVTAAPCTRCRGSGEIVSSPCNDCRGDGLRTEERSITVSVPAGVDNGATLRVSGQGPAGSRGRPPGDLYVHLRVAPHELFERSGSDLVTTLHIPMTKAALGAEIELPTLDGTEQLDIAAGTQTGRVLRLRGKGVPHLRGRGRGDILVRIAVDTPTKLGKREEELLRQLAEVMGDDVAASDGGILSRLRSSLS
ncbi:MAG TPA: molecular chaperone DnaJ [Acidimicrobiales bacterium]|nr:molecular chaperone DnaJ [Acidimicrobiales bacterium]